MITNTIFNKKIFGGQKFGIRHKYKVSLVKIGVLFIVSIIFYQNVFSQEFPVYQKYILHPAVINPAVIGSGDCSVFKLCDRHQWLGIKNAPNTQLFCAETTIKNEKTRWHGLGTHIYYDANGANKQLGLNFGYSFHFFVSREHDIKLGMGLLASVNQITIDERDFSPVYDPIVTYSIEREIVPNANTGIFLYNDNFFAGLSAVQLLPTTSAFNTYKNQTGYFFHTGFLAGNSRGKMMYLPSLLFKMNNQQEKQIDFNTKFIYRNDYWVQISYRHVLNNLPGTPNSILTYIGLNYNSFSFAYGFDIGLTNIQRYNFGSHEFMIGYKICREKFLCPVYR